MKYNKFKLEDLSEGGGSYGIGAAAVDYNKELYTYLRITDIKEDGTLDYNNLMSVKDEKADQYILKENDICFARTGNSTGKAYFYDGKIPNLVYAGFLIKFSLDESKVNPRYIKYYTMSKEYKNWVNEIQTGSTRGNINAKMYGNLEINIPDRIYQDKIVKILDQITFKIEKNSHTNNNLHEIGLALVKNHINKYNNKIELNKVIKFIKGKKPTNITIKKDSNYERYLTIACLNSQELTYANPEKMVIAENELLMVMDGASSGDIYYADYGIVGSTLAKIDVINNKYNKAYIYFFIKNYTDLIKNKNTGSAIPHTDKSFIGNLEIPEIDLKEQEKFEKLLSIIQQNQKENETLAQLRDTLLPKLMNGEIDLDKVEI